MYTDDVYGVNGASEIMKLSNASGICLPFVEKLSTDKDINQVKQALNRILMYGGNTRERTYGVVFFGSADIADEVLNQAETFERQKLQFIFTDSVQFRPDLFKKHYQDASGALVVEPEFRRISSLETHLHDIYSDLTKLSQRSVSNPWLEEVFRKVAKCPIPTALADCSSLSDVADLSETSLFTYYMTQLAFVYAKLIKNVYQEMCTHLPCAQLESISRETITRKLSGLSVSYATDFGEAVLPEIADGALVFHGNGSRVPLVDSSVVYEVKNLQLENCPPNTNFCFKKVSFSVVTLGEVFLREFQFNFKKKF